MSFYDPNAHAASIEVPVPAEQAFAFMADGLKQSHWALGSMNRRALGDNLFVGQSSFDGEDLYVRIESDPALLLVDYAVGPSPDELLPAVEARIRRGEWMGRDPGVSVITLAPGPRPFHSPRRIRASTVGTSASGDGPTA